MTDRTKTAIRNLIRYEQAEHGRLLGIVSAAVVLWSLYRQHRRHAAYFAEHPGTMGYWRQHGPVGFTDLCEDWIYPGKAIR